MEKKVIVIMAVFFISLLAIACDGNHYNLGTAGDKCSENADCETGLCAGGICSEIVEDGGGSGGAVTDDDDDDATDGDNSPPEGPTCISGQYGCPCLGGGVCASGLACLEKICRPASDGDDTTDGDITDGDIGEVGGQGQPCYGNHTCNAGLVCYQPGICAPASDDDDDDDDTDGDTADGDTATDGDECPIGTLGCACDNGACSEGNCLSGLCLGEEIETDGDMTDDDDDDITDGDETDGDIVADDDDDDDDESPFYLDCRAVCPVTNRAEIVVWYGNDQEAWLNCADNPRFISANKAEMCAWGDIYPKASYNMVISGRFGRGDEVAWTCVDSNGNTVPFVTESESSGYTEIWWTRRTEAYICHP